MKMRMPWMLIVLAIMAVLYGTTQAFADNTITVPVVGTLDLTNFVKNAGAIDTLDNHLVNRAGVSVRGIWYPNDAANPSNPADQAWGALEALATWDTSGGAPSGLGAWMGLRADTLGGKLFGLTPSVGHLAIPSIEVGPMVMYLQNASPKQHLVYGGAVAAHW